MKINCCSMCFEKLGKRSTLEARTWVELCMRCTEAGGYVFVQESLTPQLAPVFRSLEISRYISTCEINEVVSIRCEGHLIVEDEGEMVDAYCIDHSHIHMEFDNER